MIVITEEASTDLYRTNAAQERKMSPRDALNVFVIEDLALESEVIQLTNDLLTTRNTKFPASEYRTYTGSVLEMEVFHKLARLYLYAKRLERQKAQLGDLHHEHYVKAVVMPPEGFHFVRALTHVDSAMITYLVAEHGKDPKYPVQHLQQTLLQRTSPQLLLLIKRTVFELLPLALALELRKNQEA